MPKKILAATAIVLSVALVGCNKQEGDTTAPSGDTSTTTDDTSAPTGGTSTTDTPSY